MAFVLKKKSSLIEDIKISLDDNEVTLGIKQIAFHKLAKILGPMMEMHEVLTNINNPDVAKSKAMSDYGDNLESLIEKIGPNIIRWSRIEDEKGKAVPFSVAHFNDLMETLSLDNAMTVFTALMEQVTAQIDKKTGEEKN